MNQTNGKRKYRPEINDATFYTHKGNFVNKKYNNNIKNNINNNNNINSRSGSSSNRVLAGFMAYEFLTKGTLMGQKFDPARPETVSVSAAGPVEPVEVKKNRVQSYADVAQMLKGESGVHIPGVFNPTQLARWIQM